MLWSISAFKLFCFLEKKNFITLYNPNHDDSHQLHETSFISPIRVIRICFLFHYKSVYSGINALWIKCDPGDNIYITDGLAAIHHEMLIEAAWPRRLWLAWRTLQRNVEDTAWRPRDTPQKHLLFSHLLPCRTQN